MSAARSLKMPDMPVAEAIASICMSIASKIGPFRLRALELEISTQSARPTKSVTPTQARGFSRTFLIVLLKNWKDSATCVLVHVVHLRDDRGVRRRRPPSRSPSTPARRCPAPAGSPEAVARRHVALASASGGGAIRAPAPGPGVCRNTSWTSISTARLGAGIDAAADRRSSARRGRASAGPSRIARGTARRFRSRPAAPADGSGTGP